MLSGPWQRLFLLRVRPQEPGGPSLARSVRKGWDSTVESIFNDSVQNPPTSEMAILRQS